MYPVVQIDGIKHGIGIGVEDDLMPPYKDIPEDFRDPTNPWVKLQNQWFFKGLVGYEFVPKPGVDKEEAMAHLGCIQRSWEPKHEHKESAVAFLMSEWFDDVKDPNGKSVIARGHAR